MLYSYCLYHINIIGSSGDVFPNLSVGSHTMNVQFTPAESCEAFALEPTINIDIVEPTAAPTTTSKLYVAVSVKTLHIIVCSFDSYCYKCCAVIGNHCKVMKF